VFYYASIHWAFLLYCVLLPVEKAKKMNAVTRNNNSAVIEESDSDSDTDTSENNNTKDQDTEVPEVEDIDTDLEKNAILKSIPISADKYDTMANSIPKSRYTFSSDVLRKRDHTSIVLLCIFVYFHYIIYRSWQDSILNLGQTLSVGSACHLYNGLFGLVTFGVIALVDRYYMENKFIMRREQC